MEKRVVFLTALAVFGLSYVAAAALQPHPHYSQDQGARRGLSPALLAEEEALERAIESGPGNVEMLAETETESERSEPDEPEATLMNTVTEGGSRVVGRVDLRPSWTTVSGEFHTENMAEVGYQFNPDVTAYYQQNFQTNLNDPTGGTRGMSAFAQDGLVRVRFNNVWADDDHGLYFNYEPRIFLPTYAPARQAGMITAVRNYFVLRKVVSPSFSLSAIEIPIAYFYDRNGFAAAANPAVEHRIYVVADLNLTKDLSFSFPVMFHNTRYRDYAPNVPFNNGWKHTLWIWPELAYKVATTTAVGVAYYSDNLIRPDVSALVLEQGMKAGVAQMFLRSSL